MTDAGFNGKDKPEREKLLALLLCKKKMKNGRRKIRKYIHALIEKKRSTKQREQEEKEGNYSRVRYVQFAPVPAATT